MLTFLLITLAHLTEHIAQAYQLWGLHWARPDCLGLLVGVNFFSSPVPISLGQFWFPRLELHLFYNLMVFVPMIVALYYDYRGKMWETLRQSK